MGIRGRLRHRPTVPDDPFSPMPGFRVAFGEETRFVTDDETLALMRDGHAQHSAQEQFTVLEMLADEGRASTRDHGFAVWAEEICRLDDEEAAILQLPTDFTGTLHTSIRGWTASPEFDVELTLQTGTHPSPWQRRGPIVLVDGSRFRTSLPLLHTLRAIEAHAALPTGRRGETENVRLVARLQRAAELAAHAQDPSARDESFALSLGALDQFTTVAPQRVGLIVEPQADGSLTVEPDLGPEIERSLLTRRWHQIDTFDARVAHPEPGEPAPDGGAVLRADTTLVLLEPDKLAAVREVRNRPTIPADQVPQFEQAAGSFYDPELVDVDIAFSVRVAGLGVIAPITFAEASTTGLDWFSTVGTIQGPDTIPDDVTTTSDLDAAQHAINTAWERGETIATIGERLIDVSDHSLVEQAIAASRERLAQLPHPDQEQPTTTQTSTDQQVTVGMHIVDAVDSADALRQRAAHAAPLRPIDYSGLRLTPFPHQRAGIEWMTGLMQASLVGEPDDPGRIQGALLADDMGLGKTFMTLVALAEAQRTQALDGTEPLPCLAVLPLALLENWLVELHKTFGTRYGPFDDIVVLQGEGLAHYRQRGASRETAAQLDDLDEHGMVLPDRIHASLRVGPAWGAARLDRPAILVITTYETLRRYQVSLGLIQWGVVVLDEAQMTKNPETLATRAAKALKARFKLLATGTPVENSLRDFWSLLDTAQPGLLGTWAQFRQTWVEPMENASPADHQQLGRSLREAVGPFMLRRVKEDHLTDLPAKHVHEYRHTMPTVQACAYDAILEAHRASHGKGSALKTLHELSAVSLHPGLIDGNLRSSPPALADSARTFVMVQPVLDAIRDNAEKAIVFVKSRELQRALVSWLLDRYGVRADVVNGETAATGTGETRMRKIEAFEARAGFNVIIMSPLAAGVGLNVVGANHAIHLERHWNPAKEAQATDRVYRIGQTRDVHVHIPIALHPTLDSFDVNLDRLLRSKVALKDAVVVPREVTHEELERCLGLTP